MSLNIDSLIEVLSKGYYSKIPKDKMHDRIEKYFICRFETYKFDNNIKNSENLALVDTIDYFSKQKQLKWNLN